MRIYMRDTKIDVISFDMDGVLVPRPITVRDWYDVVLKTVQSVTMESREDAIKRLRSYNIYGNSNQNQGSVTKVMMDIGFSREEWNRFKAANFDISRYVKKDTKLLNLIKQLQKKYILILMSNNSHNAVTRNLLALGIPEDAFMQIATYESPPGLKSEANKYKFILSKCNSRIDRVLAIGDKFESDIAPVLEMGGSGILIEDYTETKDVCQALLVSTGSLLQSSVLPQDSIE